MGQSGKRGHSERSEESALAVAGVSLPAYEVIGQLDAPAIVVLGGISADSHICSSDEDPTPGWWEHVARSFLLAPSSFRLVGIDFLDAGRGEDGRPIGVVTTQDQADAVASVLDEIGIDKLHAIVGASYGGMVALAFAEKYPERVERLVVIGAAHRSSAMTQALRVLQRRIVELGLETGRGRDALVLARGLAMTTFRSARDFAERFATTPVSRTDNDAVFPVESYLRYHGERFAAKFTPARFLALSLSAELHSVEPAAITTPTTLVAVEGDTNVPRELMAELADLVAGPARLVDLPNKIGHDAFLTEPQAMGAILSEALTWSLES